MISDSLLALILDLVSHLAGTDQLVYECLDLLRTLCDLLNELLVAGRKCRSLVTIEDLILLLTFLASWLW